MKRLITLSLAFVLLISNVNVMAKETKKEMIDYEKLGYEKIVVDEMTELYVKMTEEEKDNPLLSSEKATRSVYTKHKSVSAHFYLTSNGATVCSYGLDTEFEYDNATFARCVKVDAWADPSPGWNCNHNEGESNLTSGYARAYGSYDLYQGTIWNNSSTIKINCNSNGTITTSFN